MAVPVARVFSRYPDVWDGLDRGTARGGIQRRHRDADLVLSLLLLANLATAPARDGKESRASDGALLPRAFAGFRSTKNHFVNRGLQNRRYEFRFGFIPRAFKCFPASARVAAAQRLPCRGCAADRTGSGHSPPHRFPVR